MKKLIIFTLIISTLLAAVSTSHYKKQNKAFTVTAATVEQGALADAILASGNLEFDTEVQIRSEITGRVEKVSVKEGDRVEPGQELMRLDSVIYEADLRRAEAQVEGQEIDIRRAQSALADLEQQLDRRQRLYDKGLIEQETIDSLKFQLDVARIDLDAAKSALTQGRANLAMAQNNLSKTVYRAPIAGVLTSVEVKPGETVIAGSTNIIGSPLMTLADPSAIVADLRVDEADIANVHLGQKAEIFVASHPKEAVLGEVIQIATSARANEKGQGLFFKVKVLLQKGNIDLRSGMSCRGEIILSRHQASTKVPIAAVHRKGDAYFIWLIEKERATQKEVTLGLATDLFQEVLSGVSVGDQVIVGPARTIVSLTTGAKVRVE